MDLKFFNVEKKCTSTSARTGVLNTEHGQIKTPIFMPIGTQGTVKAVHQRELTEEIKAQIILGNTYHLMLRPGTNLLEKAGGLHKFINWKKPMLTDSGGYQVYSLSAKRKIKEEGVKFQSHIDGSYHFLTPESAVDIQRSIGADIVMALDECTPYPCEYNLAKKSMNLTHRWLKRGIDCWNKSTEKYNYKQYYFPIIQGSTYIDLRKDSAKYISDTDQVGNAIGGLSVGEPADQMYEMTQEVCAILPKEKPRYLMGVGTPANILESIALGVDMFDCVMPTRNARNGMLFTSEGIINILNKKWEYDFDPIDTNGTTYVDTTYSKAYLRHLFKSNELLGKQIASIHNLGFYLWLVTEARTKIEQGVFAEWKNEMVKKVSNRL